MTLQAEVCCALCAGLSAQCDGSGIRCAGGLLGMDPSEGPLTTKSILNDSMFLKILGVNQSMHAAVDQN